MNRIRGVIFALTLAALSASAGWAMDSHQPSVNRSGAEIQLSLRKLTVLGGVLYIAAHPDDENTSILAYFAKGRKLRTAYLAITRGDGGQNLIGTEQGPRLGLLRTQELLAARRLDGAEQYFTRAIDFGYSKTDAETLRIWDREGTLGDMVWTIRQFQPDVIVSRFAPDGGGHGHHSASAKLALEAFHAAADPARFPEQLDRVGVWQARRIFWNRWRQPDDPHWDPNKVIALDPGAYEPLLGMSWSELAARARTMHKSQGFGVLARRGGYEDYFQLLAGEPALKDPLEGIDLSWGRVPGSEKLAGLLEKANTDFRPDRPAAVLPTLLAAWEAISALPESTLVRIKREELREVIQACAGLWLEAIADTHSIVPGESFELTATAINRSGFPIGLEALTLEPAQIRVEAGRPLEVNRPETMKSRVVLPPSLPISQPYWWLEEPAEGSYLIDGSPWRGLAEDPPALTVDFQLAIGGITMVCRTPVLFRWRDQVRGELYRPLAVTPPVMIGLEAAAMVFPDDTPREVRVTLVAGAEDVSGTLRATLPEGWRAEPPEVPFELKHKETETVVAFRVHPPARPDRAVLALEAVTNKGRSDRGIGRLDYEHIPLQTFFPRARLPLTRLELARSGQRLGYIMGAGDDVPECLQALGYQVDLLSDEELARAEFARYDAIVAGVRAYNTRPALAGMRQRLLDYVAGGGTYLVQYNVERGLVTGQIGPYPLELSRDRVTDENAPVRFLQPESPFLTWPNRLTAADFEGWVQERSLYHAKTWDPAYTPLLGMADPGEAESPGGLLVARHGQGAFILTGLAFFRQLPAGVPGAYRLFANLLAGGKERK